MALRKGCIWWSYGNVFSGISEVIKRYTFSRMGITHITGMVAVDTEHETR